MPTKVERKPDGEPTNGQRAEWASDALRCYESRVGSYEGETETATQDLLSDLMHVADRDGFDFDEVLRSARDRYSEEVEGACDCDGDLVPGAFYPVEHDGDSSRAWVERCDNCKRFGSDYEAAREVAQKLGVGWATSAGAWAALGGTPWLTDPETGEALPFGFTLAPA